MSEKVASEELSSEFEDDVNESDISEATESLADSDSEQSESSGEELPETEEKDEGIQSQLKQALDRVQELDERLRQLQSKPEAEEEESDEEISFDAGTISLPAEYGDLAEPLKGTLNSMGTVLAQELEKVRRESLTQIKALRAEVRRAVADGVRKSYKLDRTTEGKIAAFAQEHGFQYTGEPQQLEKLTALYRRLYPVKEDEEENGSKPKGAKPTIRPRPKSTSSMTTRPAKRASMPDRDAKMLDAFNRSKSDLLKKMRSGRI